MSDLASSPLRRPGFRAPASTQWLSAADHMPASMVSRCSANIGPRFAAARAVRVERSRVRMTASRGDAAGGSA